MLVDPMGDLYRFVGFAPGLVPELARYDKVARSRILEAIGIGFGDVLNIMLSLKLSDSVDIRAQWASVRRKDASTVGLNLEYDGIIVEFIITKGGNPPLQVASIHMVH